MATRHIYHGQGLDSYMTLESGRELHYLFDDLSLNKEFAVWLDQAEPFRFVSRQVGLKDITIRPEIRKSRRYWYGYLRQQGKLRKEYIGQDLHLTPEFLESVALKLNFPGKFARKRKPKEPTRPRIDRQELAELVGKLQQVHAVSRNNFTREKKLLLQTVIDRLSELGHLEE